MIEIVETATLEANKRRAAFHRALSALYDGGPNVDVNACLQVLALCDASGLRSLSGPKYDIAALTSDALDCFYRRRRETDEGNSPL